MKKKLIIKVLLLVFSTLCILSCSDVFAITTDNSKVSSKDGNSFLVIDKGNINVSDYATNDVLKAYKIIDVFYNKDANVLSYQFTTEFANFLADLDISFSINEYMNLNSNELQDLSDMYGAYIKNNSVSGILLTNGVVSNVGVGSYMIFATTTYRVYSSMVGSISLKASNGSWVVDDCNIVAKVSDPTISVTVGDGNTLYSSSSSYSSGKAKSNHTFNNIKKYGTSGVSYTSTIGEVYNYYISVSVPRYPFNSTNKKYSVRVALDDANDFAGNRTISILDAGKTYTSLNNGQILDNDGRLIATANFDSGNNVLLIDFNQLENITSSVILITVGASLNSNAIIGSTGNIPSFSLTYSNDPYGTTTHTIFSNTVAIYTYGIELSLTSFDDNDPLDGAIFAIYSDPDKKNKVGVIDSFNNGLGYFGGLKSGVYYIVQEKAPIGFDISDVLYEVVIGPDSDDVSELVEGFYHKDITNKEISLFPETGGIGTLLFTIVGIILIGSSFYFIVVYQKREKKSSLV